MGSFEVLALAALPLFVGGWYGLVCAWVLVLRKPPAPVLPSRYEAAVLHLRSHLAHLPHDVTPGELTLVDPARIEGRLAYAGARGREGGLSLPPGDGRLAFAP